MNPQERWNDALTPEKEPTEGALSTPPPDGASEGTGEGRSPKGRTVGIALILAVVVGIGIGYSLYSLRAERVSGLASTGREVDRGLGGGMPAIVVAPLLRDLGEVSVQGGTVTTFFTVRNPGDGVLVITDMETSCMCTEVALIVDGVEGPRLGMRGHGPRPEWSARLNPGEEATLKVYYDPTVHEELRGPVTRVVRVHTNVPTRPYVDILIDLVQTD